MRTIFIISHAPVEFTNFDGYDFEIKNITVTDNTNKILFAFNEDLTAEMIEQIKSQVVLNNKDTLILFHGEYDNFNLPASLFRINIGTNGYATIVDTPRWYYEKLLKNKLAAFDEVWSKFYKYILKSEGEKYFNECIAESQWKELPKQFATPIIIEKWNELNAKPFDSQALDYDAFYKLVEDTWQE